MLIVISPSKGQDFSSKYKAEFVTIPEMLDETTVLFKALKRLSVADIEALMSVSNNIAVLNYNRYRSFSTPFTKKNARPAFYAFVGDVYSGFAKQKYKSSDFKYIQKHLRILSGLYGALRPFDLIQAYRLEMKTKLKTPKEDNLYDFWGNKITMQLNQQLANLDNKILINLASKEYFKAIRPKTLEAEIVNIHFKEIKSGVAKVVSIYAKKARGMMANYIVQKEIDDLDGVKKFKIANYRLSQQDSDKHNLVFTRKK